MTVTFLEMREYGNKIDVAVFLVIAIASFWAMGVEMSEGRIEMPEIRHRIIKGPDKSELASVLFRDAEVAEFFIEVEGTVQKVKASIWHISQRGNKGTYLLRGNVDGRVFKTSYNIDKEQGCMEFQD